MAWEAEQERNEIIRRVTNAVSAGRMYRGYQTDIAKLAGISRQRVNEVLNDNARTNERNRRDYWMKQHDHSQGCNGACMQARF